MDYKEIYNKWLSDNYFDKETKEELEAIRNDEKEVEDRFYKDLEFGTAGLRGKIGAGINRMNKYIIARATQGLADFICEHGSEYMNRGVAIAYDCRHYSREFAKEAALVLAANSIKVFLFDNLRPTPLLSFTVGYLGTSSGIVVTASHNPKEYNGYKVYWEDGAQIGQEHAEAITERILKINDFKDIRTMDEKEALDKGLLNMVGSELDDVYVSEVRKLSLRGNISKDIGIIYTPLNGTGNVLVSRVLRERGFSNFSVVPEQENPDPDFTTVPFPNPEDPRAFEYAERLGHKTGADVLIATDPDCDRLAVMVKSREGKFVSLNGNQTGAILVKYIIESGKELGRLPMNGFIVKSIVTGDLGKAIAERYGIRTFEALTGFKNICGLANELQKNGEYKFVFGYEESIGYVTGNFVKDKDGVISSMLLCEAAAYYKGIGRNLLEILEETYKEYGFFKEIQISIVLEGIEGSKRINRMMEVYRKEYPVEIGGIKLANYVDYKTGKDTNIITGKVSESGIPLSNVLKFTLEDGSWYAVRPSGTEPKIKLYIYSHAQAENEADKKLQLIKDIVLSKLQSVE